MRDRRDFAKNDHFSPEEIVAHFISLRKLDWKGSYYVLPFRSIARVKFGRKNEAVIAVINIFTFPFITSLSPLRAKKKTSRFDPWKEQTGLWRHRGPRKRAHKDRITSFSKRVHERAPRVVLVSETSSIFFVKESRYNRIDIAFKLELKACLSFILFSAIRNAKENSLMIFGTSDSPN